MKRDIVVMGASAGGVEALQKVVRGLPKKFNASLFVVLHLGKESFLPEILQSRTALPVAWAKDLEKIKPGRIYAAPFNSHLMLELGTVRLVHGPKENNHLPAIDPLFRSAASVYGPRVIGVVLSGTLDDGTAGLMTIKAKGGQAVIQDSKDALFPEMPLNAMKYIKPDFVLPAAQIGAMLGRLADAAIEKELRTAGLKEVKRNHTPFTCPTCQGVLSEYLHGNLLQYSCEVGHKFSPETLLKEQSGALESALWSAYRALEEDITLAQRLASSARERGDYRMARRLENHGRQLLRHSGLFRRVLHITAPSPV